MKKLLLLKKITFLFMAVLLFSGPISAQELLIYVADTNNFQRLPGESEYSDSIIAEAPTIAMFEEDGYDVQIFQIQQLSTADQSVIDMLNEADLIYIGRRVFTDPNFMPANKQMWNDLYPPIMTENMWALRNSRLNWFNTVNIYYGTGMEDSVILKATIETDQFDDEVFDGLDELFEDFDITDSIGWWYGSHNIINPDDVGNGTVMATAAGGIPIWVRFEWGEEFYPGSVDEPGGERVYFGLGYDGADEQFYSRYTEVSKEIFLREAARLSYHFRGADNVKKVNYGAVASKVYFNPVTQNLVIEMNNLNKVEVFDISGKLVYTALAKSNKLFIDLGFVESGIYLVRLIDNNNNFSTNKIIK